MVTTKQLNIKNRSYYFYNDLINIKDFDPELLKLKIFLCIILDMSQRKMNIKLIV